MADGRAFTALSGGSWASGDDGGVKPFGLARVVGVVACLLAAVSAVSSSPPEVVAALAVVGAVGLLARPRSIRGQTIRPTADLAETLLDVRTVQDVERVVIEELRRWPTIELSWVVVTPHVDVTVRRLDPLVARDVERVLSRLGGADDPPQVVPLAYGEAVAVPCGARSGLVLVVALAHDVPAGFSDALADLALIVGFASRQLAVDAVLDRRRESTRFEELVRFSSDAIFIVDAVGTIRYAAPSVTGVLGYLSVDVEGKRLADLVDPAQADDAASFLALVQRQDARSPTSVELRLRRADGTEIAGEVTGSNLLSNSDVRGVVVTIRDVSARHQLEQQLRHQAFHDALTGMANRALFNDRLERAMRVRRSSADHAPAVAYLDLDDFKTVNDSLGHAAGDLLLRTVAERIAHCLRGSDTAARLGGDEFAILIEEVPDDRALLELIQRVVDSVGQPITLPGDHVVEVRVSAGVATSSEGVETSDDLLRRADLAMYRAKLRGKAQVVRYEPEMHRAVSDRLTLTAELDEAINREEIVVHFQPIVDLETEKVVAVEALARWPHLTRGMLSPVHFIGLAEETGLIVPLGRSVLRSSVEALSEWHDQGLTHLMVSVNISPRQFHDDDFAADLFAILDEFGIDPTCLMLEITEACFSADHDRAAERLGELVDAGVRIAVDDFGTGHSSLSTLQQLPFHQLKIDRGFVSPLRHDDERALAATIVDLARSLGADAVAEGIETASELHALRRMGCTLGQGHFFGLPTDRDAVLPMLLAEGRPTPPLVADQG